MWKRVVLAAALVLIFTEQSLAHGGGLDASGCHNDRKRGGYHCHRAASPLYTPPKYTPPKRRKVSPTLPLIQTPDVPAPATGQTKIQKTIRAVQEGLLTLGYFDGPITGTMGPKTKKAIRDFETAFSLPVTGRITPDLLNRLDISF